MFYRDGLAACGRIAARKLVIFSHASVLANTPVHALLIRRSLHLRDKGPGAVLARFHRNTPHAAEPPLAAAHPRHTIGAAFATADTLPARERPLYPSLAQPTQFERVTFA
ncbi:hypothetical protein OFEAOIEE_LOCUS3664 [Methylorubrum extorquens]